MALDLEDDYFDYDEEKEFPELAEFLIKLYDKVQEFIETEAKKGNNIQIEKYSVTPRDFEILMQDKYFKRAAEGNFFVGNYPVKPNLGGYEVVRDETSTESTILYRTYPK